MITPWRAASAIINASAIVRRRGRGTWPRECQNWVALYAFPVSGDQHGGFHRGRSARPDGAFPERLEDWIGEDDLVRVVDLFVDALDLPALGFERASSARTGRPGYHSAVLLKLFIYGYLNRIPSIRRAVGWNARRGAMSK